MCYFECQVKMTPGSVIYGNVFDITYRMDPLHQHAEM